MKRGKRAVFAVAVLLVASVLAVTGCKNAAGGGSGSGGGQQGGGGWTAADIGINMKDIPAGSGISAFKMAETELTQKQYRAILEWAKSDDTVKAKYSDITKANSSPSEFSSSPASGETQENRPVERVTWYDAVMYCNLLTMKEIGESECVYNITNITYNGDSDSFIKSADVTKDDSKKGYRLPTADEWEYAAKGGADYTYAGSNTIGDVAWYTDNRGRNNTHEVKKKRPNGYGLYDMSGNVWEWCWDTSGSNRVDRGGGWFDDADDCAVSIRSSSTPSGRNGDLGFRVVSRP